MLLHRAQPSVVRMLGRLRLTDVVPHQDTGRAALTTPTLPMVSVPKVWDSH